MVYGVGNLEVDGDGFCEWRFRGLGLILGQGRTVRCGVRCWMIGCGLGKKMGESRVWRSDGWEKGVGFF